MNNIPKENPISRVLAPNPLKRNAAHERTTSPLSAQQNTHKHQKGSHKHLIPPQLLRALLAKLVATLRSNNAPFKNKSPYHHNRQTPEKKPTNKQ